MAKRYGGKHSPGAAGADSRGKAAPLPAKRLHPVGARVNFLFIVPLAFVLRGFFSDTMGLALNLSAFGVLMLAAWLTRDGVIAHAAYDDRQIARRPAIPRKIFGAVLTGAGLGVAALASGSLVSAAIFAVIGAVLHGIAFGPDPLRDKGMEGVDQFQNDRVTRAVEEAENHLTDMADAIRRAKDRALVARIEAFSSNVRQLFRAIEDDPRRLSGARRYLGVYLVGARDATLKFADLYARTRDTDARADYVALLDDLEANFNHRRQTLLTDDRQALDIEMEVLRERLQREGLRPDEL
ncbi:5-bromo-4-chloroindolyl phosphate hydrolysis family protein [Roseicitreum antarcticum]|uniref:5-bromo-4-chloroindolyl phosphate hydrolysis protein n=1 Tax=Roseicitreum antarcticum TaxID=564137 RepID=A0A1H2U4N0_9RHOB|nr:5-bromo-4-chloroindolyl phosphate hydrolysis family protein [Roseicitreum antarcticum]SDW51135.1 5-bromo-4-chloroindolyl phosphate hydrolysis protein [Roseicitreum antarcticum]